MLPEVSFSELHDNPPTHVLQINLQDNVNSYTWLLIQKGLKKAETGHFDCVLLNMNTYGGEVLYADSIRTAILNAPIPVYVFINHNAASAGALIAIACDSIYMTISGTIGASTVVDQTGAAAPDKYQSYMRGIIRATAEAQGKMPRIQHGDTMMIWRRNPKIAEAMVDPDIYIKGLIDKGKVLTFTANEAAKNGYCEGLAKNVTDVLKNRIGLTHYDVVVFKLSGIDKLKGRLMGTALRAILIMIIVAGIWFELQSPGIGIPAIASLAAAILFFAPLYLDGFAQYWEIIAFLAGVVLLLAEIFIIPGFGIAGISGSILILVGLTFALVDNSTLAFSLKGLEALQKPFLLVSLSILIAISISLWITAKIGKGKGVFHKLALTSAQLKENGFIAVPPEFGALVGKVGETVTILKPSGKVRIEGKMYDAMSEIGYIESGTTVIVKRYETGQVYVTVLSND